MSAVLLIGGRALDPDRLAGVVAAARRKAARGTFDGSDATMPYLLACKIDDDYTRTRIIFTRDTGHHSSGWMKNPDYERCWHLSLSPFPAHVPVIRGCVDPDRRTTRAWVNAFFGDSLRFVWMESAKSAAGVRHEVQHWRLFCDAGWQPLLPRGEVYSTEFTEKGWRSASQVLAEDGVAVVSTVDPS